MSTRPELDALSRLSLSGAVPLDSRPAAGTGATAGPAGANVIDVTEASFATDVIAASQTRLVVLDFWASWCGPCKQLSPILDKLAAEGRGRWVLARVDVDDNPRLAQAAQVQGIPAVKAVLDGQVVAEFSGALPEPQVRQWITALLDAAGQATDGGPPAGDPGAQEAAAPVVPPDLQAGDDALAAGELDAAEAAYQRYAETAPASPEARAGLARVALLRRAQQQPPADVGGEPVYTPAALASRADTLLLDGRADEAFALLVEGVRRLAGPERDEVRAHLLSLFDAVGEDDPSVSAARRSLANALF